MNRATREQLLVAYDALSAIVNGETSAPPGKVSRVDARCDYCGDLSATLVHDQVCAIGRSQAALRFHVPSFLERERWLGEPSTR